MYKTDILLDNTVKYISLIHFHPSPFSDHLPAELHSELATYDSGGGGAGGFGGVGLYASGVIVI